jgi:type I restriction enzyme R subunit
MPKFNEKSLVEDYFAKELESRGWTFIPSDNLERESLEEPILVANLVRALKRLNADVGISDEEITQVLNELKLKPSGPEGAKQILNYLKEGTPVKFEKERVVHYVKLFDYKDITNNEFILSRQIIHQAGNKQIRNDMILYVNGIPLVNIECKNPASLTENWYDAYVQIRDYANTVPELYKYVQVGVAAEQTAKYFAPVPWQQEETKIHQWRETNKDAIDSTIEMLKPATLLDLIHYYLFFRIEHGAATKVVARYMQYRAAEKIFNRVLDLILKKDTKNKGLIWHWQGSGKTLTMIFAANKLYHTPELENPTIFFVVDREELQEQLYTEYTALDIAKPETIDSIQALRQILMHDEGRGKRGTLITLIHKFRPEEIQELERELEAQSQKQETIMTRINVIGFVDEGHRSQYGTLAGQMRKILKNASFFAFTGTPISKIYRNTYKEFSYPPEENYLDSYFITDSIIDGFTVNLAYQPRLEKEVHLPTEMLDTFFKIELEEIPEEYREQVEEKTKQRLNTIKMFLENPKRISKITKDISEHFKENVDGKFKAIIAAGSRKACVTYKRQLDEILPKEYTEIVMTYTRKDPKEIDEYHQELKVRFHGKEDEDIRKEIIEKYKEETLPKILIVKDMLLTGFDAPILQTMYLDQPLKEHRLLQAVARTNRPYKDLKESGLILDYVGILKNFHKAFENYTREDIKNVLIDLDELRKQFIEKLEETLLLFENVPKDQFDRLTMLRATEVITLSEQNTKQFQENYKELRKIFELLGSDPTKIEKLPEYKWLTAVYIYYLRQSRQDQQPIEKYVKQYFAKTLKYVYKTTEIEDIQKQLPIINFDENYLKNLEEKLKTKEEKAANIFFTLNRFILVEKEKSPIYESLAERVEKLLKLWKERTKDYELIYTQGTQMILDINKLTDRKKQLGFSNLQYGVLLTLEKEFGKNNELVQDTKELCDQLKPLLFKDWYIQPTVRKSVERQIRTYIRKYIKPHRLNLTQIDQLDQKIMENVKTYGQER